MISFLDQLGGLFLFLGVTLRTTFKTHGNFRPVVAQISSVCFRSLSTVAFAGVFVGAILVLQFNLMLVKYDAVYLLGGLNTSAVIREIGPLIISFLLAGKVGAYTAAELGTMRVTEQIDAIECLGKNPIQYLIVPRFLGIVYSSMILLLIGLVVSVVGSIFVSSLFCDLNPLQYIGTIPRFTTVRTLIAGMIKSLVYGIIVAGVSCHQGYHAKGGARGVGKAVTWTSIYTNFYIVIANYITGGFLHQWMGG